MRRRDNVEAARDLRQRMTPAEERLWSALSGRQAAGWKVRRQHPVGAYVLDFAVPSIRLGIELDGGVHHAQQDDDDARAVVLAGEGYRLLRFPNQQVLTDLDGVIAEILAEPRSLRPDPDA